MKEDTVGKPKPKSKPRKSKPRARPVKPVVETKSASIREIISTRNLTYLANLADQSLNKAGNITSSLGQEISVYVKTKGLNAQAFRDALKCLRKAKRDPIAARAFLDDREDYLERMGVNKLAASDMFKGGERKLPRRRREPAQADLSERQDLDENVHSLDEHRETNGAVEHAAA